MFPHRILLSLALLGLLTVSCAYPHNSGSDNFQAVEDPTEIEESEFGTTTILALLKRASPVTCAKSENGRPLEPEEVRDIKKLKNYRADIAAHPARTKPNDGKSQFVSVNGRRLDERQDVIRRRNYAAHVYTNNQIGAAMVAARNILDKGKPLGSGQYPHIYSNFEGIPFDGGSNRFEFPIKVDNKIATFDENVLEIPDRVIFEYIAPVNPKLLGVVRHGPADAFFKCV